jgi:Fe-S-cluster containining protein
MYKKRNFIKNALRKIPVEFKASRDNYTCSSCVDCCNKEVFVLQIDIDRWIKQDLGFLLVSLYGMQMPEGGSFLGLYDKSMYAGNAQFRTKKHRDIMEGLNTDLLVSVDPLSRECVFFNFVDKKCTLQKEHRPIMCNMFPLMIKDENIGYCKDAKKRKKKISKKIAEAYTKNMRMILSCIDGEFNFYRTLMGRNDEETFQVISALIVSFYYRYPEFVDFDAIAKDSEDLNTQGTS